MVQNSGNSEPERLPMTIGNPTEAVDALMDRFAKPCIRIHRPLPPPRTPKGRSKFGGLPNLPPDIEWPYGREHFGFKRGRIPLHFMAQIDCSELPRCHAALPASGMLFFFANIDDAADWMEHDPDDYRRVIYAPHVASDQAVRLPPADMPDVGTAGLTGNCYLGGAYPLGYRVGHLPDDPLTGKIYFEWPVQFVTVDSYPATDAVRKTPAWAALEAEWLARSQVDKAFNDDCGGEDGLLTMYQEGSRERLYRNLHAALNISPPTVHPARSTKKWRRISAELQGPFPPVAAFASEIATAIDNMAREKIYEVEGRPQSAAPADSKSANQGKMFQQLSGVIRQMFGGGSSAPIQDPQSSRGAPPDWTMDLKLVRQEATDWLRYLRALAPDHALDAEQRERFLAWLDDLEERNWARVDGHQPQMQSVEYAFDQAMFQLARLAASNDAVRAHFPDELYRMYSHYVCQDFASHQMFGHFPCSQEPRPLSDPMVPLLMLSYDISPDFRICDVGELQFFIAESDLRARNFRSVEAQMQGG
jgi:uncharacterized protein YwqG